MDVILEFIVEWLKSFFVWKYEHTFNGKAYEKGTAYGIRLNIWLYRTIEKKK